MSKIFTVILGVTAISLIGASIYFIPRLPSIFKDIQNDMKKTLSSKDISNSVQGKFQNGEGISISDGQYPTIANTGVLSFQGKSGNLELASGSGILIEGLEITNIDPGSAQRIFGNINVDSTILSATTNTDTFYINSGNGINLITDPINKKITINNTSGGFGWSDDGAVVRLSDGADNVGVNTSSPTSKFQVEGTVWLRGNNSSNGLYVDSSGKVGIGTVSPSDNLDVSGKLRVNSTGVGLGTSPISALSFASSTYPAGGIDFGGDTTLYRSGSGVLQSDNTFKAYLFRSQGVADTWTYDMANGVSTAMGFSAWGRDTSSRQVFGSNVSGDSDWRFLIQADGKIIWGSGTSQDTNLYRSAADTLKTDDSLVVNGNLTVNGTITGPSSGTSGYWTRSSTTLSPTNSGDSITTSGNISTTASGAITSASTLTASNGLTMTTGALSMTASSGSVALTLSSSTTAFNVNSNLFDIDTSNSRVGIGTTPSYKFDVAATATQTSSYRGINSLLTYSPSADMSSDNRYSAGRFRVAITGSNNVTAGFDNFSNIVSNPYINMTSNPTLQTIHGLDSNLEFSSSNNNTITTYNGVYSQAYAPSGNTTTITNLNWINTGFFNNGGTLTVGTQKGLYVQSMVAGTTNYGIHIAAQTNGTSDYGIRLDAADTQTLWISGNADNTTVAAGIAFGSSRDTNLYRSAADRLQTDDDFYAQRLRLTGTANTWAVDLTNTISTSNGFSAWGRDTASRQVFGSQITGETSWRYNINADGKTEWGDGGVTRDTNLYRSAADTLKTDDAFVSGATLTASNGFTMTTGALSLTATSGSLSATGLSSASLSVTSGTLALATATSGNITLTTGATTGLVNILTGNLKIGSGTPNVTLDGDDAYITGSLEVDGTSEFDGRVGIGSAAPSSNMFKVAETKTNTSGFDATVIIQDTANPSTDSSMSFIGSWSKALTGSGNAQNFTGELIGNYGEVTHQGTATVTNAYSFQANPKLANTGTITNAIGFLAGGQMTAVGTISNRYGIKISNFDNSGGGTLTANYGMKIDPQTAGTSDYGLVVGASDTQTLQVSYNADNTTAAAGIAFGSSRDTNIYRSAANTLKTDSAFVTGSTLDVGSIPATGNYTAALCWDNSGASQVQDCVGSVLADYAEIYPVASGVEYGEIVTTSNDLVEVNFTETDDNGNPLSSEKRKISKLIKSTKSYEGKIIGITSRNYGDFSSVGHNTVKKEDNPMPVALNGRVPVKVSTENGAIMPGDYLTSSSQPGVAMKATRAGQVIGKALESYSSNGISKILVFVNIGYADPNGILENLAISSDGQLISTRNNLPTLSSISPVTSPDTIITTPNSTSGTKSLNNSNNQNSELIEKINALSDRLSKLETNKPREASSSTRETIARVIEIDDNDSGFLRVRSKPSTTGSELSKLPTKQTYDVKDQKNGWYQINYEASDSAKLGWVKGSYVTVISDELADSQNNSTASPSASLAFADVLGLDKILDATPSGDLKSFSSLQVSDTLKAMNLNVSGTFKSLGDTYLGKTLIAGDLTVDGTLSITDGNALSVVGTLYLQKGSLADNLDLFNGAVTINKSGKITAKEIETDKIKTEKVSVGAKTLGSGVIPSGQTSINISNDQVGDSSNIFITPNSQTGGQALVVSSQETGKGFTVTLDYSYSADIKFRWWIVDNN